MFKSKLFWIITALLITTAAAFLIYKKFYDTSNLAAHIPKNAAAVFTANFKSLSGKINYEKLKTMNFMQEMKKQNQYGDKEETEFVKNLMTDPFSSGVNFMKDCYAFAVGKNNKPAFGIVFEVSDADKFETFVKSIPDVKNLPAKQSSYTTLDLEEGGILAWNSNTAILVTGLKEGKEKYADQLMTMQKSESIASVETFQEFRSSTFDLGLYFGYDGVIEMLGEESKYITKEFDFSGVTGTCFLNFETNKVVFESKFNDPNGKLEKTNILAKEGVSKKMLSMITNANVLGVGTFVFDPAKLEAYILKNEEYARNIDRGMQEFGITVSDIDNLFGGEITVCAADLKNISFKRNEYDYDPVTYQSTVVEKEVQQIMPMLIGSISLKAKGNELCDRLLDMAKAEQKGKYRVLSSGGISAYFIKTAIGITITNSSEAADEIADKGEFKATPKDPAKTLIADYPYAFFVDLNKDHYPKAAMDELKQQAGSRIYDQMTNAVKELENISASSSGTQSMLTLNLKEGTDNSLFRLINMVDEATLSN